jgi:hypothetical protein
MDLNYTADGLAFRDQVAGWPREWGAGRKSGDSRQKTGCGPSLP